MEKEADIAVRLAWHGARVTSVVLENGLPAHGAAPARPVGRTSFAPWDRDVPPGTAELLAKVLFPPPVRHLVADRTAPLGPRRYLRIRLLLPDVEELGPYDLGTLRWEAVRVPSALAGRDAWTAWADTLELPPDGGTPLGRHPWFTLVRDVVPKHPPSPSVGAAPGLVTVADATSVHGAITTRGGRAATVPEPAPGALGDADGRRVEAAVRDSRLTARAVDSPATAEAIRQTLAGGAQVFYFGGHHVAGGLVVGDSPGGGGAAWLDVDVLSAWLRDGGVGLAVLMACDSAGPSDTGPTGSADSTPVGRPGGASHGEEPGGSAAERLVRAGVPHVVAVQGKVSHDQAARFAGRFFTALVGGLDIDLALREGTEALEGAAAVPVLYARHDSARLAVGLLPTLRPAQLAPVAHRMPIGGGTALTLPDERHRVQLDVRWCLAERPVRDVLADPGADDLPTPLTEAEWVLLRARGAKGLPHEDLRRWYVHDVIAGRLPGTEAELRVAVSPAYTGLPPESHRGVGLVLRCRAADVPAAGFPGALDRLDGFGWDLRAVVLQVYGEHASEVQEAAEHLARTLGRDEYLVRAHRPEGDTPGPSRPSPLAGLSALGAEDRGAGRLLEVARAVTDPVMPGPAPAVDVRTVVEDLNSGAVWGDPADERKVLAAVRLWWPSLYGPLLEACSAGRTGPGRAMSLRLAADRDDDLDRWLRAAGGDLPLPWHIGPLDRSTPFADSVVLGMVRTGLRGNGAFEEWLDEASGAVSAAVALLERPESPFGGPDMELPEVAVALDRAGVLAAAHLKDLDPGGRWPGSWALLARRPLTMETAGWLYGLDEGQRRALGIAPASDRFDLVFEDQLVAIREAFTPPLRHPGADG
ncbi:CHAT domain-containing protein [Streptomyces sp. NBC_01077]|uniref:CHAT domain-containing protein n=1 Tax=Streptomyces sp. NBC_01077 TaxID=2903746 RepID=UPI003864E23C|nr:CHAT domain-containing protein [Streptomyces sp. NBC_01077]